MAITSDIPTTIPAQPEKTFDIWWLTNLSVQAPDMSAPVTVGASFEKARSENGVGEFAGVSGTFQIDDLFALAANNPTVAALIDQLLTTVGQLAKGAGVIT